jgi:hypothetical protein
MLGRRNQSQPDRQSAPITPDDASTQQPLDCSWCAAEQGAPATDSPGICAYHQGLMFQQSAERRAQREARQ